MTTPLRLTFAAIRDIIEQCGPLTMREIAEFFPSVDHHVVSSTISAMRYTVVTKQVYIQSWTMDGAGRHYPRPIYGLGNKRDAKKPKSLTEAERHRKRRAKLKFTPQAPNSVFALADFLKDQHV